MLSTNILGRPIIWQWRSSPNPAIYRTYYILDRAVVLVTISWGKCIGGCADQLYGRRRNVIFLCVFTIWILVRTDVRVSLPVSLIKILKIDPWTLWSSSQLSSYVRLQRQRIFRGKSRKPQVSHRKCRKSLYSDPREIKLITVCAALAALIVLKWNIYIANIVQCNNKIDSVWISKKKNLQVDWLCSLFGKGPKEWQSAW